MNRPVFLSQKPSSLSAENGQSESTSILGRVDLPLVSAGWTVRRGVVVKEAVLGEIIRVGRAGVQKCDRDTVRSQRRRASLIDPYAPRAKTASCIIS